jgi:hypothetical protein
VEEALNNGRFYISLCNSSVRLEDNRILTEDERVFFQHFDSRGKVGYSLGGEVKKGDKLIAVYRYSFKIGKFYYGVQPVAVIRL